MPGKRLRSVDGSPPSAVGSNPPGCYQQAWSAASVALWVPKTLATWADSRGNASAQGLRQVAGGSACTWLCVG
jgi:glycogen debranching enzyme